jgi:hypothetical protein
MERRAILRESRSIIQAAIKSGVAEMPDPVEPKTLGIKANCVICGKSYSKKTKVQICCSRDCSDKRISETKKDYYKNRKPVIKANCEHCGKEYIKINKHKTCSESCAAEMLKKKKSDRWVVNTERNKKNFAPLNEILDEYKKRTGLTFTEIAQRIGVKSSALRDWRCFKSLPRPEQQLKILSLK